MIRKWTSKDERDLLRMSEQGFSDNQIARHFNCTSNRIRQRRNRLKGVINSKAKSTHKKAASDADKLEKLHLARAAMMPCAVAHSDGQNCSGRIELHHIRRGSERRSHRRVIPLCAYHHRDQKNGCHAMSRDEFNQRYNIFARKLAEKLWSDFMKGKEDA